MIINFKRGQVVLRNVLTTIVQHLNSLFLELVQYLLFQEASHLVIIPFKFDMTWLVSGAYNCVNLCIHACVALRLAQAEGIILNSKTDQGFLNTSYIKFMQFKIVLLWAWIPEKLALNSNLFAVDSLRIGFSCFFKLPWTSHNFVWFLLGV